MSSTTQRTAIVTGAARGIGAATAIRLAADGHAVAVLDLDEQACGDTVSAITAAGGRAIAVGVDVSRPEQVEAAVARVAQELGAPTILVNNAGIIRAAVCRVMSVAMKPGATALAVTLNRPSSMARVLVNPCSPALAAA